MILSATSTINSLELLNDLNHKTDIFFGKKSEFKLQLPKGRILLVTSPSISSDFFERFVSYHEGLGVTFVNAEKSSGEPWSKDVDESFNRISGPISGVVGIGGGSVMDFAKALAILIPNKGAITDFEFGDREIKDVSPLWLLPTTCGSGSEVTQYCVINNSVTGRKFTLGHDSLKPIQASINHTLLKYIPKHVRLETGLDAFTHCLEALLNAKRNTLVDSISKEGLRIAFDILPKVLHEYPSDKFLEKLAVLSLYGGTSISYNRTGLIHTLSVALSKYFDMSHGLLNAFLLRYALTATLPHYDGHLKNIISTMFGQNFGSDKEALEKLLFWLDSILEKNKPIFKGSLAHAEIKIIDRLMQDKGLESVTYGGISEGLISELVGRIINETR
jgi:alcohol dehydrogenase class IV